MSNQVYANNMEVSCKSSGGKSICAFPDVCFTPPLTPATPPGVPIPYPNTAMASDTSDGSTSVKSGGQEIMLKEKSYFKQSTGDEAGSAPKKNVVTSKIKGKAYFIVWSMDVKVEGENVVRHMDLTTHNHGSKPAGAPPTLHAALQGMGNIPECEDNKKAVETKCNPWKKKAKCPEKTEAKISAAETARQAAKEAGGTASKAYKIANLKVRDLYKEYAIEIESNDCRRALRCVMIPYSKIDSVKCAKQTGDHLIENATVNELPGYNMDAAPTALVEGPSYHVGTHGLGHDRRTQAARKRKGKFSLQKSADLAAEQHCKLFPLAECNPTCVSKQLVQEHEKMGLDAEDSVKKPTLQSHHNKSYQPEWDADLAALKKSLG
jgi:hypothetical protein